MTPQNSTRFSAARRAPGAAWPPAGGPAEAPHPAQQGGRPGGPRAGHREHAAPCHHPPSHVLASRWRPPARPTLALCPGPGRGGGAPAPAGPVYRRRRRDARGMAGAGPGCHTSAHEDRARALPSGHRPRRPPRRRGAPGGDARHLPRVRRPRRAPPRRPLAARPPPTSRSTPTTGSTGLFGPIFEETAPLIKTKLAPYLLGQDPLAGEQLWDVLYRQDRHARKGYEMMAISAVDNALWDLRGKLFGLPVYRLLGGPTRERRRPATPRCSATRSTVGLVRERAQAVVAQGFKAAEVVLPLRPRRRPGGDGAQRRAGPDGARGGRARRSRSCSTAGWAGTPPTPSGCCERIEEYRPRWLEEPVPAGPHRRLRRHPRATSVPDRHRRARVHPLGLPAAAPGRGDRRDPGRP